MVTIKNPKYYFYINGYNFKVLEDSKSDSEINLDKTKMFVSNKSYGYTDIQWKNFTGETMTLKILSDITDVYTGEHTQPEEGGINTFYNYQRTPHAVLKYWAQNFVPLNVKTNLQAHESAKYVVDENGFSQEHITPSVVQTDLTLIQYERPYEMEQTYWQTAENTNKNTVKIAAPTQEIDSIDTTYSQTCSCTVNTPGEKCTAHTDDNVKLIQKHLQEWGYMPMYTRETGGIEPNGRYCFHTTQAMKKFQEDTGITVTGNFNSETKKMFIKKLGG